MDLEQSPEGFACVLATAIRVVDYPAAGFRCQTAIFNASQTNCAFIRVPMLQPTTFREQKSMTTTNRGVLQSSKSGTTLHSHDTPSRIEYADALYHVTSRGDRRDYQPSTTVLLWHKIKVFILSGSAFDTPE